MGVGWCGASCIPDQHIIAKVRNGGDLAIELRSIFANIIIFKSFAINGTLWSFIDDDSSHGFD